MPSARRKPDGPRKPSEPSPDSRVFSRPRTAWVPLRSHGSEACSPPTPDFGRFNTFFLSTQRRAPNGVSPKPRVRRAPPEFSAGSRLRRKGMDSVVKHCSPRASQGWRPQGDSRLVTREISKESGGLTVARHRAAADRIVIVTRALIVIAFLLVGVPVFFCVGQLGDTEALRTVHASRCASGV